MREKTKLVYYCEFCSLHRLVKSAVAKHELHCYKNPANYRPCYSCVHLAVGTRELMDYEPSYGHDMPSGMMQKTFTCEYFHKEMFGHKAELLGLPTAYPSDFKGMTPMPTKCSEFTEQ